MVLLFSRLEDILSMGWVFMSPANLEEGREEHITRWDDFLPHRKAVYRVPTSR